ncbi:MAG: A24 family peptidase C-terminal domain-containing protein, partial [Candidatus Bathyarchaeota archaeon]|nr:A24 family peptidase C-terminal domain-containing protein [Candidatus Bathyarchaeota archaeon]
MFPGSLSQESFGKKMLVLITGYKMDIAKVKAKWHLFPMEDIVDSANTTRKLVIIPQDEGREKIVERLSESVQAKKIDRYIWATPGLPMLIFITLGLVVALVFGDVIWSLIRLVLGS